MHFRIVFKYILLILWMLLIYWFSNQAGNLSGEMSSGLISWIVSTVEKLLSISLDTDKIIAVFAFLVRKIAHFSLYFVLGILWMSLLKEYNISIGRQLVYAILFCLIYACSDEFHQLFIPGRSGNIFDAMIDLLGSLCSIFPIYLVRRCKVKTV